MWTFLPHLSYASWNFQMLCDDLLWLHPLSRRWKLWNYCHTRCLENKIYERAMLRTHKHYRKSATSLHEASPCNNFKSNSLIQNHVAFYIKRPFLQYMHQNAFVESKWKLKKIMSTTQPLAADVKPGSVNSGGGTQGLYSLYFIGLSYEYFKVFFP